MPVIPIHIHQLVEKLKSLRSWFRISRKIEAKRNLRRSVSPCLLILYVHSLHLIFIEIPSCCFHQQPTSSNQDVVSLNGQIKESQGAMTEATAIRQKEKKENTVAIQDNGGSTKGAKVGHRFFKKKHVHLR